MLHELTLLLFSAFVIGFIHTLMGPDHYVPFIVISKARRWSLPKTIVVTTFAGIGHVCSALMLGLIGISIGFTVLKLQWITTRSNAIAAWLLILLGLLYFIWGVRYAVKRHHQAAHHHDHKPKNWKELTPWILFIIFVLGPCEPLIPLIFYPAMQGKVAEVVWVTLLFALATIIAMLGMVTASYFGLEKLKAKFHWFEHYGNALAGLIIFSTGCAIKVFGL